MVLFLIGGLWLSQIQGYVWVPMDHSMDHPLSNEVLQSEGAWLLNYVHHPVLYLFPLLGFFSGSAVIASAIVRRMGSAFWMSSLMLTSIILTMGVALFPFIIPSNSAPAESLLVWNASSSMRSLLGIEIVGIIMVPVILFYTVFVYRKLWGRDRRLSAELVETESKVLY